MPPSPPAASQYEMMRDAGFKHLEYTDIDDQRATQRIKSRPHVLGENQVALNAILESITCFNFMCHSRLHVDLGPLLNFIVGENGSGKSAILTAITLCLGGKASATNRGGSLRSFVKEGEEHASLVVKIKNQGPDSYKPDQFGESIIVERHFTKSGSSGFKLKSATGRIISNRKGDVDDVVEYYCLQVDNPLNVLSQDNARQFLNAATPASKYKYFVQGTQLEQLDQDYQLLQETLEANEMRLITFKDDIAFLKEKTEKAVKLRDALTKSADMRKQSKVYSNQLAWAQVLEQEDVLQEKEDAVLAAQEEIARAEVTVAEKSEALEVIENKVREVDEAIDILRQEEAQFKDQESEAKAKYSKARELMEQTHMQERDIHSRLTEASGRVKTYEKMIRDEEQRLEAANGGAHAEKQKELCDARCAVKDIEEAQSAHANRSAGLTTELNLAQEEAQKSEGLTRQKRQEVSAAESRLRTLSQNRGDPLAGFERQVPQLHKLIESDAGFSQKPIGPIGTLIRLNKPKWSPILEKILGQSLNGFIVSNRPDQVRLFAHMERLGIQKCPIFIIPRSAIAALKEPDDKYETVLRVLTFDDLRVRDQLVINHMIEQTILIEGREEAERVMLDGRVPENVTACLCFHDKKRGHGLRLTSRGQSFSTSPVTPNYDQKPRMKTDDVESQINFFSDTLEQLRTELREVDGSRRAIQQSAQRCVQAMEQHKKQQVALETQRRNASARVTRIEEELDKFEDLDGRLEGLKNDLQAARNRQDHYGNQFGELAVQKREMNNEVERLKEEHHKTKEVLQDHCAKIAKAEDKGRRYQDTRRIALVEKNQAYVSLDVAKEGKVQADVSRDRQSTVVSDYIQQASAVAPERAYIPDGESIRSIEKKFESIKEQLRKIRGQLGASDEEIQNRASRAVQEYREAKRNHRSLTLLVDELKRALMDRLRKWRTFQRLISAHARCNFNYLLSERGFRGELLLDHKTKRLRVQVEPDETRKNNSGRNTKTLSGGEKSFSSICLLLAIWDAMGSPLRCLDEFDVFMDNVNRAISTNMLITTARRSVGKQFILITPNAIEGRAKIDKDVKIIRLTDPRQRLLADH
ncbi:P-loop containing nucleoside triphosphate hydrolase protein [Durotheca rogersii]|uniref:P-loop containing nucleoside triphosphate hydrolase protein n=1 Tax=Durotheca rogersii TaxID=419775 RepID=UPI00221FA37F|nr:P-loop containing nucleoside triphosphate hydrolase protein [Durotheca rogersii]KAI5857290.1 P-loop containing nucleoside triphosphate hydrolase protein [Durotheca rogersii]